MALTLEQLITIFRKEAEDLGQANVRDIYNAQHGEQDIVVGEQSIPITGTPYADGDAYNIQFIEAIDTSGTDITEAIAITEKTGTGFKINSPRIGSIKWETSLVIPNFNFWT